MRGKLRIVVVMTVLVLGLDIEQKMTEWIYVSCDDDVRGIGVYEDHRFLNENTDSLLHSMQGKGEKSEYYGRLLYFK